MEVACLYLNSMTHDKRVCRGQHRACTGWFSHGGEKFGPFCGVSQRDRLKPSTSQRIAYSDDQRDDALLLRLVRFGGPTGVRYGIR